jgi:hypothetical protein
VKKALPLILSLTLGGAGMVIADSPPAKPADPAPTAQPADPAPLPAKPAKSGLIARLLGGAGPVVAQAPPAKAADPVVDAKKPADAAAAKMLPVLPSAGPDKAPAVCMPRCEEKGGPRFWGSSEALLWWFKDSPAPPLLVTGAQPQPTGPLFLNEHLSTSPGFIGLFDISTVPTSLNLATANRVLFGNQIDTGLHPGARFVAGCWLDEDQTMGVEGSYFFLAAQSIKYHAESNGNPPLAIPFVDATTGNQAGYAIAQQPTNTLLQQFINTTPAVFVRISTTSSTDFNAGAVTFTTSSRLQGAEANGVWAPAGCSSNGDSGLQWQLLLGGRWIQLDEGLGIASLVDHTTLKETVFDPFLGLPIQMRPVINQLSSLTERQDQFGTHNQFWGAQAGMRGEYRWGQLSLLACAKIALGDVHETADVFGATTTSSLNTFTLARFAHLAGIPITIPTGPIGTPPLTTSGQTSFGGGLFTQPTNIGHYAHDSITFVPEVNAKLAYNLTDNIRATVGYTFFYINEVFRPGDQIDRNINPRFLTTPPTVGAPFQPVFQSKTTDFWAQGIDLGFEIRF